MEDIKNKVLSVEEHSALVLLLMKKMIKPVFLAALTTCAGFASFCFTPIIPMREFGYFASLGVIASFAVAVTLIPSLLLLRGPRVLSTRIIKGGNLPSAEDKFSTTIGNGFLAIAQRRYRVLGIAALVILISLYGLSRVVVDNAIIEYFQNETDISRSDRFIREYFGGSKELSLMIEADTTEAVLSPEVLSAVDGLSVYLTERVPVVGKAVGFTDIIKRINQVFNTDESPAGIRMARVQEDSDMGGFGGADSEFGFGFDAFDDSDPLYDAAEPFFATPDAYSLEQYSAADLIGLLDTAAGKSATMTGNEVVRELKRLVNFDGFSYYEIPTIPERYGKTSTEELQRLVSNYLILLAGDENSGFSNDPMEPTAIKTTIQLRTTGDNDTRVIIDLIKAYIDQNFPKTVRVMIGGGATQEGAVTDLIVNSQIISIVISVLVVFIIIALSNRSFIAGLVAAVPIVLAVLCNFAVMGLLGIKLNIGTALIASLSVGIGIDYTIHFIEFFKHEYTADHNDGSGFLRRTFISCGKSIIINALSVGAGFGVLAFSQFRIMAQLGALIAFSMVITALVSLTIIPVLLITIKPKFIYGGEK
jgi:predicted RND superfamily exporter protein